MHDSRWYTPKDVLQDLADVTGIRDADESFILRGHMAPPRPCYITEEDEEYRLMFGGTGNQVAAGPPTKPDLAGITEMLRMVDNYESTENTDDCQSSSVKIVISKLDPNVKEFVPRLAANSPCSEQGNISKSDNINKTNNNCILEENVKIEATLKDKLYDSSNNQEEKLKIEAMLKNRIIETANASTMKEKRERNVALMTLIKLNSTPPTLPNSNSIVHSSGSDSPKPFLLPPEYFENLRVSTVDLHIDDKHSMSPTVEQYSKPTSSLNESSGVNDLTSSADVSTDITSSPNVSNDVISGANVSSSITSDSTVEPRVDRLTREVLDPHMKDSIEKVNNWFEKPKKTQILPPHQGPIIYKKKDSPKKSEKTESKPIPSVATPAYVPSKYASDLAKQYEDRSKAKALAATDMWTKLENDLKAKDQEIMKRLKEKSEDESVSPTGSSSRCSRRRKYYL